MFASNRATLASAFAIACLAFAFCCFFVNFGSDASSTIFFADASASTTSLLTFASASAGFIFTSAASATSASSFRLPRAALPPHPSSAGFDKGIVSRASRPVVGAASDTGFGFMRIRTAGSTVDRGTGSGAAPIGRSIPSPKPTPRR